MAIKRVVIVGGVAGGASCAARLRRMDEEAEILLLDRGPFVSFANCGLPYYVGDVIREEGRLLLATPELFRNRFRIEVRTRTEALSIDRAAQTVRVKNLQTGEECNERYDALVLAPGAEPIKPAWPGVDLPGVFTVRSVPDSLAIREWIATKEPKRAVVVGGGLIGLEMAENLVERGIEVSLMGRARQVLPMFDPEMTGWVADRMLARGVKLYRGKEVAGFAQDALGALTVSSGQELEVEADLVILAIGVRPETKLAKEAGLAIGERGGIRVNDRMQTSDEKIWAIGDAVENKNVVTGGWELTPLAGPANRQGRIAADAISGRDRRFRGTQGTVVCGLFGMTAALTGATEKSLRRAGVTDYEVVYLHPLQHAGYYPNAKQIHMKLLFRKSDGLILGAQAVGEDGAERRIDVIAMAIQKQATVFDLEEAELCYAPQYGSAKDAVNMAGMIAANVARGDLDLARWDDCEETSDARIVVDVRDEKEYKAGWVPNSINIPLNDLRERLHELPREKEIWVTCGVGQRAYYACRILTQHGFRARDLSGGFGTYKWL